MQDNSEQVRQEINLLYQYRALMLARYFVLFSLVVSAVLERVGGSSVKSLYIILLYVVFPAIISVLLKERVGKESVFILCALKKKYHYTNLDYIAQSIAYIVLIILLMLWQISNNVFQVESTLVRPLPSVLIFLAVLVRVMLVVVLCFKLHADENYKKHR